MRTTESDSLYNNLETLSVHELLTGINNEDAKVAEAIKKNIHKISSAVEAIVIQMKRGGRLFYMGAGTSGRLGVVDASELPPTYGVEHGLVIGLIAGGDTAIRKAVEFAEDDENQGWKDLQNYNIVKEDFIIGIAASGSTPYVVGALKAARANGNYTACITCNENSPLEEVANFPIVVNVGPEFVTGSTRMKAGTAQKLILNMISTTTMIKLGRIKGNKMVDMQLSNNKLIDRGARMIMEQTGLEYDIAKDLLEKHGSVRKAVDYFKTTL